MQSKSVRSASNESWNHSMCSHYNQQPFSKTRELLVYPQLPSSHVQRFDCLVVVAYFPEPGFLHRRPPRWRSICLKSFDGMLKLHGVLYTHGKPTDGCHIFVERPVLETNRDHGIWVSNQK